MEAARHAATLSAEEDSLSGLPSRDARRLSMLTSLRDAMGHASAAHRRAKEEGKGLKGLGELVREIEEEAMGAGGVKGSRFAHAVDFGTDREAEEVRRSNKDSATTLVFLIRLLVYPCLVWICDMTVFVFVWCCA